MPALFIRKLTVILFFSIKENISSAEFELDRSKARTKHLMSNADSSFFACLDRRVSRRAMIIKLYLSDAITFVNSNPMPSEAPVTIA